MANKIKSGDLAAREQLITANLALVVRAVRDYKRSGIPLDDLIQEGNLGLLRAAECFDPSSHTARFATYAKFWIQASLVRAVVNNGSLIQVPERLQQLRLRYRRAIEELRKRMPVGSNPSGSGQPSVDAIATHMGVSSDRLLGAELTQSDRILRPILDELLLADEPSPDQIVSNDEDRALVHAALRRLSPFEAWVIRERYGLAEPSGGEGTLKASRRRTDGGHKAGRAPTSGIPDAARVPTPRRSRCYYQRSYREIGCDCGLSAHRIQQVERTAIGKLGTLLAP
ncbi:MAG: sigma-70 family RNA polymerase sigma factor [Isosphaerales bacterium]